MMRVGKSKVDAGEKRVSILVKPVSSRKYGIIVLFISFSEGRCYINF